jgi:hypothetical protein
VGEGTRVTATIPVSVAAAREAAAAEESHPAPRVLPVDTAEALQAHRKHGLVLRSASFGIVAGVLIVIWALTGPDLPWIVWPLLGIGLVAALDAWRVLGTRPLTEADLEGAPDRDDAVRRLTRTRRLRHHAGALAILNLFIVGVWLASGSSYFWPAWVMLGSAVVIAIEALPRPAARWRPARVS